MLSTTSNGHGCCNCDIQDLNSTGSIRSELQPSGRIYNHWKDMKTDMHGHDLSVLSITV